MSCKYTPFLQKTFAFRRLLFPLPPLFRIIINYMEITAEREWEKSLDVLKNRCQGSFYPSDSTTAYSAAFAAVADAVFALLVLRAESFALFSSMATLTLSMNVA